MDLGHLIKSRVPVDGAIILVALSSTSSPSMSRCVGYGELGEQRERRRRERGRVKATRESEGREAGRASLGLAEGKKDGGQIGVHVVIWSTPERGNRKNCVQCPPESQPKRPNCISTQWPCKESLPYPLRNSLGQV